MIDPRSDTPWFGWQGFSTVPVGAVVAFAGQLGTPVPDTASPADVVPAPIGSPPGVAPTIEAWGWMACDGRALSAAGYGELFAMLGYLYGGSGGSFNLPDYRGYFLRGTDWGAGNDPDASARTPATGGSAASVGSTQASALLTHCHDYPQASPAGEAPSGSEAGMTGPQTTQTGPPVASGGSALSPPVSANETRPLNIAVTYIIKFTAALHAAAAHRHRYQGD